MAKDCMGGIRDPDWLDLPPIASLGIGVHSLANLPNNSTIKKKAAVIIMAVEVHAALLLTINLLHFPNLQICFFEILLEFFNPSIKMGNSGLMPTVKLS